MVQVVGILEVLYMAGGMEWLGYKSVMDRYGHAGLNGY